MAGDRTLRSSREVPAEWIAQARKSGLTVGEQLSFATMTFAGDTPQLADVKAVDDRYPLYGTLETQPPGLKPQAGSVLLAPRLMALLNLKTGDTIDVGDATLRIAGEVIQEPDAGFNPFQMAPRLMMNMADVAKTGAVQPGSRVAWRYKFAGDAEQLANYEQWLLPKLGPEHRWIGLDQDDSALGKSLERSQQFLLLSALLTLLLAVAAVAVAMSHYCRSRYDLVAILKTLGAGRSQLRKLIVGQWLLLLTLSVITGGVAAWRWSVCCCWCSNRCCPPRYPLPAVGRGCGLSGRQASFPCWWACDPIDCCWRLCRCECCVRMWWLTSGR